MYVESIDPEVLCIYFKLIPWIVQGGHPLLVLGLFEEFVYLFHSVEGTRNAELFIVQNTF